MSPLMNILTLTLAYLAAYASSSASAAEKESSPQLSGVQLRDTIPDVLALGPANSVKGECSCESWKVASIGCMACNCNSCGSLVLKQLGGSCAALAASCLASYSERNMSRDGRQGGATQEQTPLSSSRGYAMIPGPEGEDTARGFVAINRVGDGSGYQLPDVGVKCIPAHTVAMDQDGEATPAINRRQAVGPSVGTNLTSQNGTVSPAFNETETETISPLSPPVTAGQNRTVSHTANGTEPVGPPAVADVPVIGDKNLELELERQRAEIERLQRELGAGRHRQPPRQGKLRAVRARVKKVLDKFKMSAKKLLKTIFGR